MNQTTTCRCLYCNAITGSYPSGPEEEREVKTVCHTCAMKSGRSERLEIDRGVNGGRPWQRPLIGKLWPGQRAIPDAEAAQIQAAWESAQASITEHNAQKHATPAMATDSGYGSRDDL